MKQPDPIERRYVLYFNESVRGLSVGAPVTLFGLRVGEVTDVGLTFDPATLIFRPRVLITFFPERLIERYPSGNRPPRQGLIEMSPKPALRMLRRIVEERGLRAQLRTGSFLTGELYVAFEYFPNAPKVKIDWSRDPLELPVVPGGLASLEAKLSSILTKIDNMPLDAIGIEVKNALATLNQTLKDAATLVNRVDAQWVPEGTKTLEELRQRDCRRRSSAQQRRLDALRQGLAGAAGPARHAAGSDPRRACGACPRRLSRASPRNLDPGQAGGETLMRRIASITTLCAIAAVAAGCATRRRTSTP